MRSFFPNSLGQEAEYGRTESVHPKVHSLSRAIGLKDNILHSRKGRRGKGGGGKGIEDAEQAFGRAYAVNLTIALVIEPQERLQWKR